jgi:hypothetical protein
MANRDPPTRHGLRQAGLTVVDAVTDRRLGDEAANSVLGSHDPRASEFFERSPDREPVDAVSLGQLRLRRQPLAARQLLAVDPRDTPLAGGERQAAVAEVDAGQRRSPKLRRLATTRAPMPADQAKR